MSKILATVTAAALIVVTSVATTSVPANAHGISFSFGNGWGHHGINLMFEVPAYDYEDDDDEDISDAHIEWCDDHYQTYDEDTDTYAYEPGKRTRCIAPFD
jgi:hypothetical protein